MEYDLTLLGNYHHVPVQQGGNTTIKLRCHFCGGEGPIGKDDESLVVHKDQYCPLYVKE